jgi:hypothetical protein
MAFVLGNILGMSLGLLVILAITLTIGKIPWLRGRQFGVHIGGVALVWACAIAIQPDEPTAPISAYLVTLVAIWSYRQNTNTNKAPNGWYRLGAGISVAWSAFGEPNVIKSPFNDIGPDDV